MVYPRVHDPVLYEWEIDKETHDRYDYPRAWPSAGKLHVEFSILAAINALTASFVFLLIVAICRSKRVRSNVFSMYLLAIAFPDFMVSFLCCITCALSAPGSQFYSEWMCGFQSFYLNWAFISNAWLNGVVVFQIHRMLRHSHIRRRYSPPTHKQVLGHASLVYAYSSFWGFLCGFNIHFLPHSSHLYYGFACMPMEYDRASTLFFWLVYLPMSLGIPLIFASYVTADIFMHKLLPPTGKRRALSMFLLRLCFLYFAVWLPFLVLFLVGNFVVINPVVHWIGAAISHLQGLFSALFCLTNTDISLSFMILVTCRNASDEDLLDATDLGTSQDRFVTPSPGGSSTFSRVVQPWIRRPSSTQGNSGGPSGALSLSSRKSEGEENNVDILKSQVDRWNSRYTQRSSDDLIGGMERSSWSKPGSQRKIREEQEGGNCAVEQCTQELKEPSPSFKLGKTHIQGHILEETNSVGGVNSIGNGVVGAADCDGDDNYDAGEGSDDDHDDDIEMSRIARS